MDDKEKKKEGVKHIKPEIKEKPDAEKLNGIDFNRMEKENTIKGCFFAKEE